MGVRRDKVDDLGGRTALVTGAGLGIGQGIAIELARQGARVAVHYGGSEQGAMETVAQIEAPGGTATAIKGDLRLASEAFRVVDEAIKFLGAVDILVNNAGVTRSKPFLETDEATYDEMFNLNIKGY